MSQSLRPSTRPTTAPSFDLEAYAETTCGSTPTIPVPADPEALHPDQVPVLKASGSFNLEILNVLLHVDGAASVEEVAKRAGAQVARVCEIFGELEAAGFVTLSVPPAEAKTSEAPRSGQRASGKTRRVRHDDDAAVAPKPRRRRVA